MAASLSDFSARQPFFVVGCPRSGTTLLQTILDSHPDVAVPPESHFFRHYRGAVEAETPETSPWEDSRLIDDLLENFRIKSWRSELKRTDLLPNAKNTSSVFERIFCQYARSHKKSVWGDKTPQHAFDLDIILSVFPKARIIYMVRDGRDVAESYLRAFIGPAHIATCAERWKTYVDTVQKMRTRIGSEQFLRIRYEDLVLEPEVTQRKLWQFLGLSDPGAIEPSKSTAAEIYLRLSYLHKTSQESLSANRIGRFKDNLSHAQILQFEQIAGKQLIQESYQVFRSNVVDLAGGHTRASVPIKVFDAISRLVRKILFPDGRRQLKDDWMELRQRIRRKRILRKILQR
ncbi:MAG: sulfotransferase family protein [Steroidobacteraceae bacterium]